MDKVKEAKRAVEKHASIYHERTMKPCCQGVLRELMLAVLDEAESEFMFRGKAIRKAIKELAS